MIIILEGMNGTGKTMLAKKLAERYNMEYQKDKRIEDTNKNGFDRYMKLACNIEQNTIQDRFHLGECVYPVLKKDGREPLTIIEQNQIERILDIRKAILIYCTASDEFIKNVYQTRGEDFIKLEQITQERELFEHALRSCTLFRSTYYVEKCITDDELWWPVLDKTVSSLRLAESLQEGACTL